MTDDVTQRLGVLEGDDAGERQIKSQIEIRFSGFIISCKAVNDATNLTATLSAQELSDIIVRIALVDNKG